MNKLLKEFVEWVDATPQLTRKLIKDKIIEIDNNNKPKRKTTVSKVFTPPTVEEIREYCKLRDNNIDAELFHDFYQSKGWLIGKVKMKDFKAAVRTWEKSRNNTSQNNPINNSKLIGRMDEETVKQSLQFKPIDL